MEIRKQLLERAIKIDEKLANYILQEIDINYKLDNEKWNANKLATYDNLRRMNLEIICKINTFFNDKNFEYEPKKENN